MGFLPEARRWIAVMAVLSVVLWGATRLAGEDEPPVRVRDAPEFPEGAVWLNSPGPVTLASLRGRVVLIDFWTSCCVNCIHTLADLASLREGMRGEPFAVIGVHVPKFDHEESPDAVRAALARLRVGHPIVLDPPPRDDDGRRDGPSPIAGAYAVRTWPTQILLDAEGRIRAAWAGEGHRDEIERSARRLIADARARGIAAEDGDDPAAGASPAARPADTLAFPGKVLADAASGRLYIADTGHDRILACDLAGRVIATYGGGGPGFVDGPAADARFRQPQGMARLGSALYVADTGNHAIRSVTLATGAVATVCGTGERSGTHPPRRGRGREAALASPWDLAAHEGTLYIAMAGSHQVWTVAPGTGEAAPFAGSGLEARRDGLRDPSAFAQPSGLAVGTDGLYVADSESNSVRRIGLTAGGGVETIVGGDLFEFGDRDGRRNAVRLQHPVGIAARQGVLYLADTYNHRIKTIDPAQRTCSSLAGTGEPGATDDPPAFDEPGGLSLGGELLYIADTNNHAIRVLDIRTGAVRTLAISFR